MSKDHLYIIVLILVLYFLQFFSSTICGFLDEVVSVSLFLMILDASMLMLLVNATFTLFQVLRCLLLSWFGWKLLVAVNCTFWVS